MVGAIVLKIRVVSAAVYNLGAFWKNTSSPLPPAGNDWTLWSWGNAATYGMTGQSGTANTSAPVQLAGTTWSAISPGRFHTIARKSDNTLWAWGDNATTDIGALGDGTTVSKSSPVQIGSGLSWSDNISASSHSLAITTTGDLYAWGLNTNGQLGLGDATNRSAPVLVGSGYRAVSAAGWQSFGIKTDNTLWAWGYNTSGDLGVGDTTVRSSPTKVGSATNWSKVAAGGHHTLGLTSDGKLWTWGTNTTGQLGYVSGGVSTPTQVGTGTTWTNIAANYNSSFALITNDLYTWGSNVNGQLGQGIKTTINRSSPVLVAGNNWSKISTGAGSHVLAIKTNGNLYGWGFGTSGQLGNSLTTSYSSPVLISSDTTWQVVHAGYENFTIALKS